MAVQKSHRAKSKKTLNNMKTKIFKNLSTTNTYNKRGYNNNKFNLIKSIAVKVLQ